MTHENWALSGAYSEKRHHVREVFARSIMVNPGEEYSSPCGRYTLTIVPWETGKDTWNYTEGWLVSQDGTMLRIQRNYSHFPFAWVVQDDRTYLLCGEDYQGYTVVDCAALEARTYIHPSAAHGAGWCPTQFLVSPDQSMVAMIGCIWGGAYDAYIDDIGDIMRVPWPQLGRIYNIDDECGWDEATFRARREDEEGAMWDVEWTR